jgi:hypothetical protein
MDFSEFGRGSHVDQIDRSTAEVQLMKLLSADRLHCGNLR